MGMMVVLHFVSASTSSHRLRLTPPAVSTVSSQAGYFLYLVGTCRALVLTASNWFIVHLVSAAQVLALGDDRPRAFGPCRLCVSGSSHRLDPAMTGRPH